MKPPRRRKGRLVVCGNRSNKQPLPGEPDPSVGGVDTVAIRCVVALAVQRQLQLGSIDVKGAFLQAPRRSVEIRPTVCDPPTLVKQMGLVEAGQKWLVHKALYGFTESPSDWSFFRDECLRKLRWQKDHQGMCLQQTAEKHLWKVVQVEARDEDQAGEGSGSSGQDFGYLAVYVDDILFATKPDHTAPLVEALQGAWKCSPAEFVETGGSMRFCGFELSMEKDGAIRLSQEGFMREMVKRRGVEGVESFPVPPITDEEDEAPLSLAAIKQAQGMVGELTWLTTRSRPDISYGVGIASRLIHRRPQYTISLCEHLMRYINGSLQMALTYRKCQDGDMGECDGLQAAKSMENLLVFSDASFGPVHERCKSVSGCVVEFAGCVVAWESQAQPFISHSTAEAEVISYNSACQTAESVSSLLAEMGFATYKHMYGDSKAGIAVIANDCGPWRTRHLRLRAAKLRELVQNPSMPWCIRHMSGSLLVADSLTKSLSSHAFIKFRKRLGIEESVAFEGAVKSMVVGRNHPVFESHNAHFAKVLAVAGGLLSLVGSWNLSALLLMAAVAAGRLGKRPSKANEQRPQKMAKRSGESHKPQRESWSGTAPHNSGNGATIRGGPQGQQSLEGLIPGIRALRFRSGSKSHGMEATAAGESSAAGAGESSAAASEAASTTRRRRGAAARGADAMQSMMQNMASLSVDTKVTVHLGGKHSVETTTAAELRGGYVEDCGPSGSASRATTKKEKKSAPEVPLEEEFSGEEGIWDEPRFQLPPRGDDKWLTEYLDAGWLVRSHGSKGRVRPFHPLHRSCPVKADHLTGKRVTIVYGFDGTVETLWDEWTTQRTWQKPGPWRGYTFMEVKKVNKHHHGAAGVQVPAAEESDSSDGGYELVNEDFVSHRTASKRP